MDVLHIDDFSGGIQESLNPSDFTNRQWAQLKGIVPLDDVTFESQWPCQKIGTTNITGTLQTLVPLEYENGVFLIAVNTDGVIFWTKAPGKNANNTATSAVSWTRLDTRRAANRGFKASSNNTSAQPEIFAVPNKDFRYICTFPLELYKYRKRPISTSSSSPSTGSDRANDFYWDQTPDWDEDEPRSIVTAALFHSRRYWDPSQKKYVAHNANTQQAIVVYVNDLRDELRYITFPNFRRWPMAETNQTYNNPVYYLKPGGDPSNSNDWQQWEETGSGDSKYDYVKPRGARSSVGTFLDEYPYVSSPSGSPRQRQAFHPYTYLDENKTLLPGTGFIPRANVGCLWNDRLTLGDIEWRSDLRSTADKIKLDDNQALIGKGALRDGNTEPHRPFIYFSEEDIDKFDPRSILRAGTTNSAVIGMHVLADTLICITEKGGPDDGVIAFRGNLGALHPYDGSPPNPFALRRDLIRGNIGGFPRRDNVKNSANLASRMGHRAFSTLWAEAGVVCFVDSFGHVWATNGETCDRLDWYGPKEPNRGRETDHVASMGRYLFVYRSGRLLLFSAIGAVEGGGTEGVWTELVFPQAGASPDIKSMYGARQELYFLADNVPYRYAMDAPVEERGCIDGQQVDLTVSTRTLGSPAEHDRKSWHRVGLALELPRNPSGNGPVSLEVRTVRIQAGPARRVTVPSPNWTVTLNEQKTAPGNYEWVVPAGIGSESMASATFTLRGYFRMNSVTFWMTGRQPKRGVA